MNLQQLILHFYEKFFQWIHTIFLPIVLGFSFLSALSLKSSILQDILSRIGLTTAHTINGFFILSIGAIIIYDKFTHWFKSKKNQDELLLLPNERINTFATNIPRKIIDLFFYGFLILMSFSGLLLYFHREKIGLSFLPDFLQVTLIHQIGSWFFISIVCGKYYLVFSTWRKEFRHYLREI
ncbi:MAG: Ni,Fe-hydrogenase I cytochrome b subunit [bacterium]|jgi:Ni,Fe-hydrogenase I cytochrome b subunit